MAEEREPILFVKNGEQEKAYKHKAKFSRKSIFEREKKGRWVISDGRGVTEEERNSLLSLFGKESFEALEEKRKVALAWIDVVKNGDNLDTLRFAKEHGMPEDAETLALLFHKWRVDSKDEYQLNWKYLCDYLPDFEKRFGKEEFLFLCNEYSLSGDMYVMIEHEKERMPVWASEYLHFCYAHRIRPAGRRRVEERVMEE